MFAAQRISYHQTGAFAPIITDYLAQAPALTSFYQHPVDMQGMAAAIEAREKFVTRRSVLVEVLQEQYQSLPPSAEVQANIQSILSEDTFTVTTAHQPNLLTGPLYFLYKIIHAIRLADELKKQFPDKHFVPVFYMGSEDADLEELNHFTVKGKKYTWQTKQTGAVGRMLVDDSLIRLVGELKEQIGVEHFGEEIIQAFTQSYVKGKSIAVATQSVVHQLFSHYGLVVLNADDSRLKQQMQNVFADDLFLQRPFEIVQQTCHRLDELYKVQAHPRPINLFYLEGNTRQRIEKKGEEYVVVDTSLSFSEQELKSLLQNHPERFSPNVILRGLYQETILPNIAFIGGGGELAYWLQLKDLFAPYGVPYPVLILRNSFLIAEKKWTVKAEKLKLSLAELFQSEHELMSKIVATHSSRSIALNGHYAEASEFYQALEVQASSIDPSLQQHVQALKAKTIRHLQQLEKKMLRAEKRKFVAEQAALAQIKNELFPKGGLQERIENFSGFYAKWGSAMLHALYYHSPVLSQEFTILAE
jgi:bacillithiol synthase